MKNLFIILLILLPIISKAQYPIQTIYKSDSVIILKLEQLRDINKKIDEQKTKIVDLENVVSKNAKEKKLLLTDNIRKDSLITHYVDTLNNLYLKYTQETDSLKDYLDRIEKWIVIAANNKSFIYLDKNAIKVMNFDSYKYKYNKTTKTFKLKPLKQKNKKPIIPIKWKNKIDNIKEKIFDNISEIFINQNSLNISNYPFQYKIKKENGKK